MHNPGLKHHFCIPHDKISVLNACCVLGTLGDGHGIAKSTDAAPALKVFALSGISRRGSCHKRSVDRTGQTECQGGVWGGGQGRHPGGGEL